MPSEFEHLLSTDTVGKYAGKWIAMVGKDIVAKGDNAKEVFTEAKKSHPKDEPFIMKVTADTVMLL